MKRLLICLVPIILLCLFMVHDTVLLVAVGLPVVLLWGVNFYFFGISGRARTAGSAAAKPDRQTGCGRIWHS